MWSSSTNPHRRREAGFTLLEVLVAFVIMATVLGVIMRIYSQGMQGVGDSEFRARAVMLAESKLALLGSDIPLEEGEDSGETEDGLRWRLRVSLYDPDQEVGAGELGDVKSIMKVQLLKAEVEVGRQGQEAGGIRLTTLKLAPRNVL